MKTTLNTFLSVLLLSFWLTSPAFGQYKILENSRMTALVQESIDSIYNLNFHAADSLIDILDRELGEYPGNYLLKAFYTSWKHKPLKEEHESYMQFESYLTKAIELCEEILNEDENNEEANFFLMASHAFLAELYVNNGHSFKALAEAKSAYKYIKIGFDQLYKNPEFYFSSGIYNYYREKYPEENPFYKSFLWFFKSGDKEEGIKMLETGVEKASFTKAECLTYLFHINLRYEDDPETAMYYAMLLKNRYPNNLHYIANYIENSIRLKKYDNLSPHIQRMLESDDDYYQYLGEIFLGNLTENNGGLDHAMEHYQKADKIGEDKKCRVPHYDSILYLGMGKVYQKMGKSDLANAFLKKSVKTAEYEAYREDAQELLKSL